MTGTALSIIGGVFGIVAVALIGRKIWKGGEEKGTLKEQNERLSEKAEVDRASAEAEKAGSDEFADSIVRDGVRIPTVPDMPDE